MSSTTTRTTPPPETIDRPGGDRFVSNAMLAVAAVLLAIQVMAGHVIPPVTVFGVLFLGIGIAVGRRRTRWLLAIAIVLSLLYLGGSLPFFVTNLAHPESPVGFILEAFVALATLTTLVGAVLGLRDPRTAATRRPIAFAAGGLAVLAVVIALAASSGVTTEPRQADDVAIEAVRSTFPALVSVPAGDAVLWVDNQDPFHHTLVIEGTDHRIDLPASTSVRLPVSLEPGTYRYLCDVPGHESMAGDLDVR